MAFFPSGESNLRPMRRLTAKTVFSGLVMACRLAICPTRRSPESVKPTMEGVVRLPSLLGMTTGSPPSMTDTHELVVPRSIPITLPMTVTDSPRKSSRTAEARRPPRCQTGRPARPPPAQ